MSTPERPRGALASLAVAAATAGGVGYLRPASGTWGTAAAAAAAGAWIALAPSSWLVPGLWLAVVAATAVGLASCGAAIRRFGVGDPSPVVIDEVAGTWLALALVPSSTLLASPVATVLIAALAFRVFDIAKPWPISWLERLPGGVGIMADDLAAGLLAGMLTVAAIH
jgi:phosphatidylglycerophosphatase A